MNKLTFFVLTTITVLSSNTFAQENQLDNQPAQYDCVGDSICPVPQSSCCRPVTPQQTEPLATASTAAQSTTSAITRTLSDQVAQENIAAIAEDVTMPQQTVTDKSTHVTPATIADTQRRANLETSESTQSSHWPFPVNRWGTAFGKQFAKLTSYIPQDFPQTAMTEAVEPQRRSTPQLPSTVDFAEELETPTPRPTDFLIPQETIELSQVADPSSINSRSPQKLVDPSEYFRTQYPELSFDTQATPATLAPAIASIPATAATPIAETKIVASGDRKVQATATRTFNHRPTTRDLGVASSAVATAPRAEAKTAATRNQGHRAAATRAAYSKAGAGYWWAYSLLLLPLLGFFLWGLFRKLGNGERQQAMARRSTGQRPSATTLVDGIESTQTVAEEVSSLGSLESESANAGVACVGGETTKKASKRSVKRSTHRETELNWKEVEIATGEKPATADFLSQLDAEPAKESQRFTGIAATGETNHDSRQTSSTTPKVDSPQSKNETTTSATIAYGAAGVAGATALTGLAAGASNDSAKGPQLDETGSVSKTQTSFYRDDLTRIDGINEETQQAFYDAGYYHYSDIENANTDDLKKVFKRGNLEFSRSDFETWSGKAAMYRLGQCESSADSNSSDVLDRQQVVSNDAGDDLTRIHGITPATAQLLRDSEITTFRSLHEADADHLQSILKNGGTEFEQVDPSTWTEQTRFALAGHWTGLAYWKRKRDAAAETAATTAERSQTTSNSKSAATDSSQVSATPSTTKSGLPQQTSDDLTQIRGIGPATARLLGKSGITSFRSLYDTRPERFQTIVSNGGSQFKLSDTSSWIEQARFAMDGDWNGLAKWKTTHRVAIEKVQPAASSQASVGENSFATVASTASAASATSATADDLTKIHGIGPATAKLLRRSGITSFRSLRDATPDRLQTILSKGGSPFKLIDPSSWFEQARFATSSDWTGLSRWQTVHCVTGSESPTQNGSRVASQSTSQARGNVTTAGSTTPDDLTKIHGLGKASQKVLNSNGVDSFAQVASMTTQQLDDLFAEPQKRFQLVNKTTWPAQAKQFARTESNQEASTLNLEMEILDEIDSIREIAADARTASPAPQKAKQTSKRD